MKRRPALAGSRKGKRSLPTVLRSSPTQSDPSAAEIDRECREG